ncbi:prepilin peptidase [Vallicoccus soli]|uniref:Prepilin leader peptidase/N-methyltransferase n=1 Tax=Vallicoccus soli TaxID=2339232 RepID=A0A3A3YYA3_9ACTN|nr:A24 family peptidase [Vallicoccus soli]RJK96771.1 prepilin peptidase [Vallicoccus soli]
MLAPTVAASALLGLLVGSFLNVVVHRVPAGLSVVHPPSACPGCDARIAAYDNVPVLSWLVLRGRCRRCRTGISVRYPLVELGTACLFAVVAWRLGASWELPAYLWLAGVAVPLALIDLDVRRLPDAIVLPAYPVSAALLALASEGTGEWGALLRAGAGGLLLFALYLLLAVAQPGGMGFGDVKLAGVLGLHLGWLGWGTLVVGGFLGFLLGGAVGLALMAAGRAGRRSAIPFGPSMLAGALLAVLCGEALAGLYVDLLL